MIKGQTLTIKVGHVVTIYRGAVGVLEAKLVELNNNQDIEIIAITPPPPEHLDLPSLRVSHISSPMTRNIKPFYDLWCIYKMYRIIKREKFDIIHTHSAKAGMVGAVAAWLAKVPNILHTYHGLPFYEGQGKVKNLVYKYLEKFACLFRQHVFSQNYSDMQECTELMGDEKYVHYEGNGVNIKDLNILAEKNIEVAKTIFKTDNFKIVMISRLEQVKRVDNFIETCYLLKRKGLKFEAVVAGYGPLENTLNKLIIKYKLEGYVKLLGWCLYAPSLMKLSDVVVLTSAKEGIPRSLIEAMALKKPVVATDVLGTQELVVDNETGYLTEYSNPHEMAEKIEFLMHNPSAREVLLAAAFERVESQFNDLKIAANLKEFYLTNCNYK